MDPHPGAQRHDDYRPKEWCGCKRRQFPLAQPSAITVHKSQGGTYSSVVYEYSKTHPQKLVYVALSRCTNNQNHYLTNSDGDHRFYHRYDNVDKSMAVVFKRLENHTLDTVSRRSLRTFERDVDAGGIFTMGLLNVRSLNAYFTDVERDVVLTKSDGLCFTETWNSAKPTLAGYDPIVCTENGESTHGGLPCMSSETSKPKTWLCHRLVKDITETTRELDSTSMPIPAS